jgi:ABC-type cobalamin/Fe3+-siderophores transport system ATPase subunit
MITIDEITIVRDEREIIYDYSEQIPAGSITAIVGPNGSGKSTLLAAIAGDIAPSKGTITIDDVHPILTSPAQLAQMRAVAIQNQSYHLGFTVRQVIEMAGPADEVITALGLTSLADRLVTTLSGGEAQRVSIAAAIAQQTPVLLLDEPLSAQDVSSRKRIIELLQKLAESGVIKSLSNFFNSGQDLAKLGCSGS